MEAPECLRLSIDLRKPLACEIPTINLWEAAVRLARKGFISGGMHVCGTRTRIHPFVHSSPIDQRCSRPDTCYRLVNEPTLPRVTATHCSQADRTPSPLGLR